MERRAVYSKGYGSRALSRDKKAPKDWWKKWKTSPLFTDAPPQLSCNNYSYHESKKNLHDFLLLDIAWYPLFEKKKVLLQLMSSVMLVLARQGDHSANVLYASCTTYDVRPI